ncbi:MAG: glutamine amidotransferase family protein [Pseudomonadota bacterium]
MCGIVGLFLKDRAMEPHLGRYLADMLVTMTDRGPDSAGLAIYREGGAGQVKLTLQSASPVQDFAGLEADVADIVGQPARLTQRGSHAVLAVPSDAAEATRRAVATLRPAVRVVGRGSRIEIYKGVGRPRDVVDQFDIRTLSGSHGIGHTRMATESAVTTESAHPFNTGDDQCLVHNGSLSNHNALRRKVRRRGMVIETENDTEVAAAYLSWRMQQGATLREALESALRDLDGFFTFVVGTRDGFAVVRDPIACKPAVMAETEHYVAFGSEYRALVVLPGIDAARVWEPEPAKVYVWSHADARHPGREAA